MNIFLLAGTHSGCGKTSVMLALLQTLQQQKIKTAAFKTGPDFIDASWHQAVTQSPCYQIDTEMVGLTDSIQQLHKQAAEHDCLLIEGVMGLFDGKTGVGLSGSSLDLARQLAIPVLLVVDAQGMSGSIVPLVQGFCAAAKNRNVNIIGIIANRVGSTYHAELLNSLLQEHQQPPLIAWLDKNAPSLPERHLGLVLPEPDHVPNFLPYFHLIEARWQALGQQQLPDHYPTTSQQRLAGKTIAVSRDAAFCFIYPANIDALRAEGANIVYFSPLANEPLPDCDAVWLVGGYPELYADTLSHSATWTSLRAFIEAEKPVLAECGGMMVLAQTLIDLNGVSWSVSGILPFSVQMQSKLVALGYRNHETLRGHEFHFSERLHDETLKPCFKIARGDQGIRYKNTRASYIHWYFPSDMTTIVQWLSEASRTA